MTKLSCLCRVRDWISDNSKLSPTEIQGLNTFRAIVQFTQTRPDKTVLSCLVGGLNWALVVLIVRTLSLEYTELLDLVRSICGQAKLYEAGRCDVTLDCARDPLNACCKWVD